MTLPAVLRRVIRACLLDVDLYAAVEADATRNKEAAAIVACATALTGIGSAFATEANVLLGALGGLIAGMLGWVVWSAIAMFIGTRFLGGTADFGEIARVIAYALAPLAIGVVPWLGFVAAVWALLASVIAIREGLDVPTVRTLVALVPGWVAWLLISLLVQAAVGVGTGSVRPL